jgi:hypothetical protein
MMLKYPLSPKFSYQYLPATELASTRFASLPEACKCSAANGAAVPISTEPQVSVIAEP